MALCNNFPSVREAAAAELGRFGATIPVQRLAAALNDKDEGVRCAALSMIEGLKSAEADHLLWENQHQVAIIREERYRRQLQGQSVAEIVENVAAEQNTFAVRLTAATSRPYVTRTLIALNVVIFVAMAATGAGIFEPSLDALIKWGADFAPLTTQGQWWRLFTSAFIHIGLPHLLFNMWALYRGGEIAEKLFGNGFYLVIYIVSAFFCSLTSLALGGPLTVSAGALGAVFGVYGALVSYLLLYKKEVPSSILKPLLSGAVLVIGYNLFYGFASAAKAGGTHIDNAGYIGGVVSGFLLGFVLARPLDPKARKSQTAKKLIIGASASIALIVLFAITIPKSTYDYKNETAFQSVVNLFQNKEDDILKKTPDLFNATVKGSLTKAEAAEKLDAECLRPWRKFHDDLITITIAEKSRSYTLRNLLLDYATARGDATQILIDVLRTGDASKMSDYKTYNAKADQIVEKINDTVKHLD